MQIESETTSSLYAPCDHMYRNVAIGNAIFDATGVRLREIPFTPERVKAALVQAARR